MTEAAAREPTPSPQEPGGGARAPDSRPGDTSFPPSAADSHRSRRMSSNDRRRGLYLLAALFVIAGTLSLAAGVATLASVEHQLAVHGPPEGCAPGANCSTAVPVDEPSAYGAAVGTIAFGAVLLAAGGGLGILGWSGGRAPGSGRT